MRNFRGNLKSIYTHILVMHNRNLLGTVLWIVKEQHKELGTIFLTFLYTFLISPIIVVIQQYFADNTDRYLREQCYKQHSHSYPTNTCIIVESAHIFSWKCNLSHQSCIEVSGEISFIAFWQGSFTLYPKNSSLLGF